MDAYDPVGYLASLLVMATFCMRDMVPLRVLAIGSNVAFIAYAGLTRIDPVLLLHAVLLPMNAYRLMQELAARRSATRGCRPTGEHCAPDESQRATGAQGPPARR